MRGLARAADAVIARDASSHRFRFHGSMIPIPGWTQPFADLIAHPALFDVFATCGFEDVRWLSGYLVSKPAGGPSLWWHQDWWAWNEPCSYGELPPQLFAMAYLTDTSRDNGCLRVLPGSHRVRHPIHASLPPAHSDLIDSLGEDSVAHRFQPSERDVPTRAGDLVLGDARVLHAAHANRSLERRHCITLWYAPAFSTLPDGLRAKLAALALEPGCVPACDELAWARVRALLPRYEGAWDGPWPYERRPSGPMLSAPRGSTPSPRRSPGS